jgi:hypothetical protein
MRTGSRFKIDHQVTWVRVRVLRKFEHLGDVTCLGLMVICLGVEPVVLFNRFACGRIVELGIRELAEHTGGLWCVCVGVWCGCGGCRLLGNTRREGM